MQALALLGEGAAGPGSAWRNLTLATLTPEGWPSLRTLVLRRFDADSRCAELHTDTRSAKHAELIANPRAAMHGWDPEGRVQLRLTGTVTLHAGDTVAQRAWESLRPAGQATYRVIPGPGSVISTPDAHRQDPEQADAFAAFCVIRLHYHILEWLHLGHSSHRRARFAWFGNTCEATWLSP
jgi:hypothetical protein